MRLASQSLVLFVGLAVWLSGTPASAVFEERLFIIEPSESAVALRRDSAVTVDLGLPGGAARLPLVGQRGPVRSALRGTVRTGVDLTPGFEQVKIEIEGTWIALRSNGLALPGPAGMRSTPTQAQLAVTFEDPILGLGGRAAVRGLAIRLGGQFRADEVEPGRYAFPSVPQGLPPARMTASAWRGDADIDFNLLDTNGTQRLAGQGSNYEYFGEAQLEDLGDGRLKITIPLDLDLGPTASPFSSPGALDFGFTGQVVGYSPALVPEPGGGALGAAALLALAALRRAGARR